MGEAITNENKGNIKIERRKSRVYKPKDIADIIGVSESTARKFIEKAHKDTSGKYFPVLKIGTMYKTPIKQFDAWFDNLSSTEMYELQTMLSKED